jgi:hypothetical protein
LEDTYIRRLKGQVEVDETYILAPPLKTGAGPSVSGCARPERLSGGESRSLDGLVYLEPVAEVDKATLQDIIKDKVSIETTIYSDTWKSYNGLEEDFAGHKTAGHSEG